ncbi:MAG: hypothetical protein KAW56_10700 [Candidatus Marinimicrobia bacterium]|nr:hypothetical protein [Candidatus Neomarinimicrobiota bacterium]
MKQTLIPFNNEIPNLLKILSSNRKVCFLFNFDTLIASDLNNSHSNFSKISNQLQWIASLQNLYVGIISIETLDNLRKTFNTTDVILAGSLGYEIEGLKFSWQFPKLGMIRHKLESIYENLFMELSDDPIDSIVHNFGFALQIKLPINDEIKIQRICNIVENHIDSPEQLEIIKHEQLIKVRPKSIWDKGKAVEKILNLLPRDGNSFPLVIYFGDDISDEPAFKKSNLYGYSVIIDENINRITKARYFFRNNIELTKFLFWVHSR